jgi:hypothetical protein
MPMPVPVVYCTWRKADTSMRLSGQWQLLKVWESCPTACLLCPGPELAHPQILTVLKREHEWNSAGRQLSGQSRKQQAGSSQSRKQ